MTERFTSIRAKNPVSKQMGNYVQDNGVTILKLNSLEDCKDVCELLNELESDKDKLSETNHKLYDKMTELAIENKYLKQIIQDFEVRIRELEHENNILKTCNEKADKHIRRLKDIVNCRNCKHHYHNHGKIWSVIKVIMPIWVLTSSVMNGSIFQ